MAYLGHFSSSFDAFFYKCSFFEDLSNGDNNLAIFPLVRILVFAPFIAPFFAQGAHMGSFARMDHHKMSGISYNLFSKAIT